FDGESIRLEKELAALVEQMRQETEGVQQREQQQGELTQRGYAIESEVAASRDRSGAILLEADRAAPQQRHNEERGRELAARAQAAQSDLEHARGQRAALDSELAANTGVLDSAAADVAAAQAEAERSQREAVGAVQRLAELERGQEERRLETLQAL